MKVKLLVVYFSLFIHIDSFSQTEIRTHNVNVLDSFKAYWRKCAGYCSNFSTYTSKATKNDLKRDAKTIAIFNSLVDSNLTLKDFFSIANKVNRSVEIDTIGLIRTYKFRFYNNG